MDEQRFDTLARALAAGLSRRGAPGILAALAGLDWADSTAAKRRKRKGAKKKRREKQRRQAQQRRQQKHQRHGRTPAEAEDDKVTICHRTDSATNSFVEIEVAPSAVPDHEGHVDAIDPDFATNPEHCGGCGHRCGEDELCCDSACVAGECCDEGDCGGTTPICVSNVCAPCSEAAPCPGGMCCSAGACVASCPSCQTCEGGTCVPAADGTPCGTQPGGGTLRCCNGACPAPTCRPAGTECPGEDPITCRQQCCSNNAGFCNPDCECLANTPDPNINRCGSDADCRLGFGDVQCRCGRCCLLPGQATFEGNCASCCSGACQSGTTTCA